MTELFVGDLIKIKPYKELYDIFKEESYDLQLILPLKIIDIADQFATIVSTESLSNAIQIELENDYVITIPSKSIYTFYSNPEVFEELQHGDDALLQTNKTLNEATVVQHLAAETIQTYFRRYKECKTAIKMRRMISTENVVMNMAAETITNHLKRIVSKSKMSRATSRNSLSGQNSLRSLQIDIQPLDTMSTVSHIATEHSNAASNFSPPLSQLSTVQNQQAHPPALKVTKPLPPTTTPINKQAQSRDSTIAPPSSSASTQKQTTIEHFPLQQSPQSPSKGTEILKLTNIIANELTNVCWQGVNDVYLIITSTPTDTSKLPWQYRTCTLVSAGSKAHWKDLTVRIPFENSKLTFTVYHESLAIADKLIGSSTDTISLRALATQSSLSVDLYEGKGTKRKFRGNVSFNCTLGRGDPTLSNVTAVGDENTNADKSKNMNDKYTKERFPYDNSLIDIQSVTSLSIHEEDFYHNNHMQSGDYSPAQLRTAMDKLNINTTGANINSKHQSSASQSNEKIENVTRMRQKKQNEMPSSTVQQTSQNDSIPRTIEVKNKSRVSRVHSEVAASENLEDNNSLLGVESYPSQQSSHISYLSGDMTGRVTPALTQQTGSTRTSVIGSTTKRPLSSTQKSKVGRTIIENVEPIQPPTESMSIDPKNSKMIDWAFRAAYKQECSALRMTVKELAFVLDALDYHVNPQFLMSNIRGMGLQSSSASFASNGSNNGSGEVIELPILHPTALAARVSSIVREKQIVLSENSNGSEEFTMSQHKAGVAVRHLGTLIEGAYLKIREYILSISCMEVRNNKQSVLKYTRPSHWSEQQVHRLLVCLQLPVKAFLGVDGATFLHIAKHNLSEEFGIKPSLLQTRFRVYQQCLKQLDTWWDRGVRPGDFVHSDGQKQEKTNTKKSSTSVAVGSVNESEFNEKKVKRKQSTIRKRSVDVAVDNAVAKWGLGNYTDESRSESGKVRQLIEVSAFQPLLEALVSLNRAYSWQSSFDTLTLYCTKIESHRGYIADTQGNADSLITRWIEMQNSRDANSIYAAIEDLSHIDSLVNTRSVKGTTLFLIPSACLRVVDTTKISKTASFHINRITSHLNPDDITVGMHVRITNFEALQRTCERFEWWDHPSVETLKAMSESIGEIVSTNDLRDKQRVGIKLINSTVCDALPVEALIEIVTREEVEQEMKNKLERDNIKQIVKNSRKKSTITKSSVSNKVNVSEVYVEESSKKVSPEDDSKLRMKRMIKKLKRQYTDQKIKKSTSKQNDDSSGSDSDDKSNEIDLQEEKIKKSSQNLKTQREDEQSRKSTTKVTSSVPSSVIPPQPQHNQQQQHKQYQQQQSNLFSSGPQGGDESTPPPPVIAVESDVEERRKNAKSKISKSVSSTQSATTAEKSATSTTTTSAEANKATSNPVSKPTASVNVPQAKFVPISASQTQKPKDYSWLKPHSPTRTTVPSEYQYLLDVPDVPELPIERPMQVKGSPREVVKVVQAMFDTEHASYNDGINNGMHIHAENVQKEKKSIRPKSANANNSSRRRAWGAGRPTIVGNGVEGNEEHFNEKEGTMRKGQVSMEQAPFGVVSGHRIGAEVISKLAEQNEWINSPTVSHQIDYSKPTTTSGTGGQKPSKGYPGAKSNQVEPNYFEFSARNNVTESATAVDASGHLLFSMPTVPAESSPKKVHKKVRPTSAMSSAFKMPRTDNVLTMDREEAETGEREQGNKSRITAKSLSQYVSDTKTTSITTDGINNNNSAKTPLKTDNNRSNPWQSSREAATYAREMARTQKEADYKEKSLLKELKRLGVDTAEKVVI